jgi:dienelactone hydrolase
MKDDTPTSPAVYKHRISVRRIGQLLAGWEFIPEFVSKDYQLSPPKTNVLDGRSTPLPDSSIPVVLLAHGYLGSRFDLSHLAEELSAEGFVCIAAEYPESLAASYDRVPGLDRSKINKALLEAMCRDWQLNPSAYGIVGHSLGCGTVSQTGDETWARVSIAGFPRTRDGATIPGNGLLLASTGDSLSRFGGNIKDSIAASQYQMLSETQAFDKLPPRAALVFDGPGSPNHISFLTESVNESMMDFLSPLLPVARAFEIPVLDFDRYQTSRDSPQTAKRVHPIIVQYLKQEMLQRRSARNA